MISGASSRLGCYGDAGRRCSSATLVLVRDVPGHTNIKMTSNYLRSSNIELHDVFEGWENETAQTAVPAASHTEPESADSTATARRERARR